MPQSKPARSCLDPSASILAMYEGAMQRLGRPERRVRPRRAFEELDDPLRLLEIQSKQRFAIENLLSVAPGGLDDELVQGCPLEIRGRLDGLSRVKRDAGDEARLCWGGSHGAIVAPLPARSNLEVNSSQRECNLG